MKELRNMDLNLLVSLDAMLQEISISRAAHRLGMSTPAMSHALHRLRLQFRDPLLVRAGRGMVLSELGVSLRSRVRELLEEIYSIVTSTQEMDIQQIQRTFRIHATDHVLTVLGEKLEQLAASEAPSVVLQFLPNQPDDAQMLREGQIDLAIGVYAQLPPELRIRKLFEDRFVCVVRKNHPTVKKKISLKQYLELSHIVVAPRGMPGSYIDSLLAEQGQQRHVARLLPYFLAGLQMVSSSDYLLTVSERLAQRMVERFALCLLPPPIEFTPYSLQMIWHPRYENDASHRWLRTLFIRASSLE